MGGPSYLQQGLKVKAHQTNQQRAVEITISEAAKPGPGSAA